MAKKGKRGTPPHLDHLFSRQVIPRGMYPVFWQGYWASSNRDSYTDGFVKWIESEETPKLIDKPKLRRKSKLTKAQRSAAAKKGWITRRRNAKKKSRKKARRKK